MRIHPFQDGDAFTTFQNLREKTVHEIDGLDNDYVLKASPTELEQYYLDKASVTPLSLDASDYYIESQEGTQIDVAGDFRRATFGPGPHYIKGTTLRIAIPYSGDPQLWRIRASTYGLSGHPELEVRDDVVLFSCRFPDDSPEPERLKNEIQRTVQSLKQAIGHWLKTSRTTTGRPPASLRRHFSASYRRLSPLSTRWPVWASRSDSARSPRPSQFPRGAVNRRCGARLCRLRSSRWNQLWSRRSTSTSLAF